MFNQFCASGICIVLSKHTAVMYVPLSWLHVASQTKLKEMHTTVMCRTQMLLSDLWEGSRTCNGRPRPSQSIVIQSYFGISSFPGRWSDGGLKVVVGCVVLLGNVLMAGGSQRLGRSLLSWLEAGVWRLLWEVELSEVTGEARDCDEADVEDREDREAELTSGRGLTGGCWVSCLLASIRLIGTILSLGDPV